MTGESLPVGAMYQGHGATLDDYVDLTPPSSDMGELLAKATLRRNSRGEMVLHV